MQTNYEENKTHMDHDIFIVDWNKFDDRTSHTQVSNQFYILTYLLNLFFIYFMVYVIY